MLDAVSMFSCKYYISDYMLTYVLLCLAVVGCVLMFMYM